MGGAALFLLCARLALKGLMYAAIAYDLAVGFSFMVGMRRGEELRWLEKGLDRGVERGIVRGVERGTDGTLVVTDRANECLPFLSPVLSPFSSLLHRVTSLLPGEVNAHTARSSYMDSNRDSKKKTESAGTCVMMGPRCTVEKKGGDNGGTGTGLGTGMSISVGGVCVCAPLSESRSPRWALLTATTTLTRLREGVGERVRGITGGAGKRVKRVMGPLLRAAERWKLKLQMVAERRDG
jgi:hypothetical protein